jgi:16S rRNA (cytidine1402-2'-O)-methyltransferase
VTIARNSALAPGLHLVSVPIGNARDITLRALDVLASADLLAAEDTRSLRRLMEIHGIALQDRPLLAYHEHNGAATRPGLLAAMEAGRAVAYASEAGTPMVSDPGFDLARDAQARGLPVTAAPGVSAGIAALTLSGLPTDRFLFAGFLPSAAGARRRALEALGGVAATALVFESPRRVARMLSEAAEILGPDRPAALCRELTKKFEEVRRGTLATLASDCAENPPKGEIVVAIGKADSEKIRESDVTTALQEALGRMSVRDAADEVAGRYGLKRRPVYQQALALSRTGGPE